MVLLVAGLAVFLATHVYAGVRDRGSGGLAARLGEVPYKVAFSIASGIGLVLIVYGYGQSRGIPVWSPPSGMRHATLALMLPAMILLVATYLPLGHIKKAVKHPSLTAVKVWAFAHLLANGDLASMLLFGTFLAWAVFGRIAAKRRGDNGPAGTPGVAGDLIALLVGAGLYALLAFYLHPVLFGVSVIG